MNSTILRAFTVDMKLGLSCFAIWYHLYKLKKNVKNTHRGVILLVKLQTKACNFTKVTLFHWCFSRFLNCINDTKSRNASHIISNDRHLENEPKFYKPKSKMQELAEEFKKSKAVSEDYKSSKVLT